jgi:hypothetical protein
MASGYDPFGSSKDNYYSKGYEKPKNNKMITTILVIILIGFGIYYAATYLFLNKIDVKFDVKNTEEESISAIIKIGKDPLVTDVVKTLQAGEVGELKKENYFYTVQASGYKPYKSDTPLNLKSQKTLKEESVILEKNISLIIKEIVFPEKVYIGQTAILIIKYENTSTTDAYTLSDLVIDGDIKDWTYVALDQFYEQINSENITLNPKTESEIKLRYVVEDTKKKTNNVSVRVKYRSEKKSKNFEIVEEPNIPISGNLSGELKSGENKNYTITINNSKNKLPITDLTITLDVNGNANENVIDWFSYPQGNILISGSKNESKSISISVPQTALDDVIEGKLIFDSLIFREPKEVEINITIKEPSINFTTSLNKTNVTLKYDEENNITNIEYLTLTLDNKSSIDIDLEDIKILDLDPIKKDCNNYIYVSQDAIPNMKITRNTKPTTMITITATDPNLIGSLINNSRLCNIVIEYKHPFRTDEIIPISNNLIINIE